MTNPDDQAETADEAPQPNGVFIEVVQGESGIDLRIQALGDTRVTEVPTLLEIATVQARSALGLHAKG